MPGEPIPLEVDEPKSKLIYGIISNIRCTETQNLNDPHLALQLFLPKPLKSVVKSRMKM